MSSLMAPPHSEIRVHATPDDVFDVLVDPETYPKWLLGAQEIRRVDSDWPRPGSRFYHRIGAGPIRIPGSTSVRLIERPHRLVLGAGMGPLGEALVDFRLHSAGEDTKVDVAELPRRGLARTAWNVLRPLVHLTLWGRNQLSLAELQALVEGRRAP